MVNMAKLSPLTERERRNVLRQTESLRQLPSCDDQLAHLYKGNYLLVHCRSFLHEAWK